MKHISSAILILITIFGFTQMTTSFAQSENTLELKGTVQRFLMNPQGNVDGFMLDDGTQVKFPPHMSSQLTAVISPKDSVDVKGFRENAKVFKAETVTNTKTSKFVVEAPPIVGLDNKKPRKGPKHGPRKFEGLQQLSAFGKIQAQLFGRHGEVNGIILSDGTIVHFDPRMLDDESDMSNVKTDVGQSLQASGLGTKNS